jgi:hypothetical protein
MEFEATLSRPSPSRNARRLSIVLPLILGLAFAAGWFVEVWRGHAPEETPKVANGP